MKKIKKFFALTFLVLTMIPVGTMTAHANGILPLAWSGTYDIEVQSNQNYGYLYTREFSTTKSDFYTTVTVTPGTYRDNIFYAELQRKNGLIWTTGLATASFAQSSASTRSLYTEQSGTHRLMLYVYPNGSYRRVSGSISVSNY